MYLKHWFEERREQMRKPAPVQIEKVQNDILPYYDMSEFFQAVEDDYGQEARDRISKFMYDEYCTDLAKNYATIAIDTTDKEDILNYIFAYVTKSIDSSELKKSLPSQFQFSLADKEIKKSWCAVMKFLANISESDIVKAIHEDDWKNITSSVNKKSKTVDHTHHTDVSKTPKDYDYILNGAKDFKSHAANGQAPKMVHRYGDDTYMTKAYHKKPGYGIKSVAPLNITGWATMAMKHLYHAGGIKHLCEDVHAGEHEGVPLTVHKFERDSDTMAGHNDNGTVNPDRLNRLHLAQIACMDFLSHNTDRHSENLVISNAKKAHEGKYHKITAIDHELAFQYAHQGNEGGDTAQDFATGPLDPNDYDPDAKPLKLDSMGDLHDWWKNNHHKIKSEMEKQLLAVKDPVVREHIRRNFNSRAESLDHMVSHEGEMKPVGNFNIPKPTVAIKKILSKLPDSDPKEALNLLMGSVNSQKELSHEQVLAIGGAVQTLIESASPEALTDIYKHALSNPKFNTENVRANPDLDPKKIIREHLATPERFVGDRPVYRSDHIKQFISMADSVPGPEKEPLKVWKKRYKKLLSGDAR